MKQGIYIFISIFLSFNSLFFSEEFKFKFNVGDEQKISSFVEEDVYFNGVFSHSSQIVNRIISKVIETKNDENGKGKTAFYSCTFMTSERANEGHFVWGREYPSLFWRDELGRYTIGEQYFMPIVRNVPIFPEHNVEVGESWNAKASEAYDFSEVFGIKKPVIVDFDVFYKYVGIEEKDGKKLHIIEANYQKEYEIPSSFIKANVRGRGRVWPSKTSVVSKEKIGWDASLGNIFFYDEEFNISILLNNGGTISYVGTSHARIIEVKQKEIEENSDKIKKDIEKLKLKNTTLEKIECGLKITLENIQFETNSAILRDSEKEKLKAIAKVLKKHKIGDLLVEGHTVFSGTKERQMELSQMRARIVRDYLIELGVCDEKHIFTKGLGGLHPLFPNTTEENKAKNRRVEITIME